MYEAFLGNTTMWFAVDSSVLIRDSSIKDEMCKQDNNDWIWM